MSAYRTSPVDAKYVCIVCYNRLSPTTEVCPTCATAMVALADEGVRAKLRTRAIAGKTKLSGCRVSVLLISSIALGYVVTFTLLALGQ